METNLKFNSAICTSRSQSERLLALGLKKETADCVMMYYDGWHIGEAEHFDFDKDPVEPAWSLHRLIEIANLPQYWECISGNWYEEVIAHIQSMIHINEFNKEYLEHI